MSTYPTSPRAAFMEWCQLHAPVWAASAAGIGVSPAAAAAYTAAYNAAAAAVLAQADAKQAARLATEAADLAVATLRGLTGDTVRTIRAFAETQDKPDLIYQLAQITAPATPTPVPPPAQPTDLTAALDATSGELTLRWKASNPVGSSGTSYIIRRKLPGEPGFVFVGASGAKKFVDATLFAGPDSVQYTIQGQRGGSTGPLSAVFTINFGRAGGDGAMQAFVSTGEKEAA